MISAKPFSTSSFAAFDIRVKEHKTFLKRLRAGSITEDEFQDTLSHLLDSKDELIQSLLERKAKELAVIASRLGSFDAKRSNKKDNAEFIFRSLAQDFVLSGTVSYSPLGGETFLDAVIQTARKVTGSGLSTYAVSRKEKEEATNKALTAPETLSDFRSFIVERGEAKLSDEQLRRFAYLDAKHSRQKRAKDTTVESFHAGEAKSTTLTVKTGFHEKRGVSLWIVSLADRVSKEAFADCKTFALADYRAYDGLPSEWVTGEFVRIQLGRGFLIGDPTISGCIIGTCGQRVLDCLVRQKRGRIRA